MPPFDGNNADPFGFRQLDDIMNSFRGYQPRKRLLQEEAALAESAVAGQQADAHGFDVFDNTINSIKSYTPRKKIGEFAQRQEPIQQLPENYKPLTEEELRARHPERFPMTQQQQEDAYRQDVHNARVTELGDKLSDFEVTNPVMRGYRKIHEGVAKMFGSSDLNRLQGLTGIGFGPNGEYIDITGQITDEARAREELRKRIQGEESTKDWWISNLIGTVGEVGLGGGAVKAAGGGSKLYLGLIGNRSYDESMKTGEEAGLKGAKLKGYALGNAAAEVGVEAIFNHFGAGVVGRMFSPTKNVVGRSTYAAAKQTLLKNLAKTLGDVGLSSGEEGVSEGLTQVMQNVNDMAHGVKPWSWENLRAGVGEAFALGAATGGVMGAKGNAESLAVTHGLRQQMAERQKLDDVIKEQQGIMDKAREGAAFDQFASRQANDIQMGEDYDRTVKAGNDYFKKLSPDQVDAVSNLGKDFSRKDFAEAVGIHRDATPMRGVMDVVHEQAVSSAGANRKAEADNLWKRDFSDGQAIIIDGVAKSHGISPSVLGGQISSELGDDARKYGEWTRFHEKVMESAREIKSASSSAVDTGLFRGRQKGQIETVSEETGVPSDWIAHRLDAEMTQQNSDYELKRAVWDYFQRTYEKRSAVTGEKYKAKESTVTPEMIGKLTNDDENHVRGFDGWVQEFQKSHPEIGNIDDGSAAERFKQILIEGAPKKPAASLQQIKDVAAQYESWKSQVNEEAAKRATEESSRGEAWEPEPTGFEQSESPAEVPFNKGGDDVQKIAMGSGRRGNYSPTGSNPRQGGYFPQPSTTIASNGGKVVAYAKEVAGKMADFGELVSNRRSAIRKGRTAKRALGQYHPRTGAMRLKNAGDLTTLAHEVGHQITENTDLLRQIPKHLWNELIPLGRPQRQNDKKEGYSEFLRLLMTDPIRASQAAPQFTAWHEQWLKDNHPAAAKMLEQTQDAAHRWFRGQGAQERAQAQLVNPHSFVNRWRERIGNVRGVFTKRQLNDLAEPLREFVDEVKDITGKALAGDMNAWEMFKAYRNTFSGRINKFIEWGQFDASNPESKTGKSLGEILDPVSGSRDSNAKFSRYLFALSSMAYWNKQLMVGGRPKLDPLGRPEVGMNPGLSKDDAQQIVSELENEPGYKQASQEIQDWNKSVNKYIGTFDETYRNTYDHLDGQYDYYLPHQRVMEMSKEFGGGQGASGAATGNVKGRRHGGGEQVVDQLSQLVNDKAAQLRRAMQRNVVTTLLKIISDRTLLGNGRALQAFSKFMEEVPIPNVVKHTASPIDTIRAFEKATGLQLQIDNNSLFPMSLQQISNALANNEVQFFGKADSPKGSDDVFVFKTKDASGNVTSRWFVIKPEFRQMLNGISPAEVKGGIGMALAASTRLIKLGAIGLSPRFGFIRNVQRDLADLLVKMPADKTPANIGKALLSYMSIWSRAAAGAVTGKNFDNEWMSMARSIGVEGSHLFSEHIPAAPVLLHRLQTSLRSKIVDPRNWFDAFMELTDKVASTIGSSEMASRTTAMKQRAEAMGWRPGMPLSKDVEIALALAYKESMGDYTAKGALMRDLDLVIPFASTPITYGRSMAQALLKPGSGDGFLGKLYRPHNIGAWATGFATLTIPTIALWLRNRDKEWYRNLSASEKYGRLIVEIPGQDTAFLWNRSSEAGVIFSAFPEAMLDWWYKQDPAAALDFANHVVSLETPDPLPPIAMEALRQAANREDIFSGRQIVPERESINKRPTGEQYTEQTSKTARLIGRITGVSPLRLEHAADKMTGGLTKRVTDAVESVTGVKERTREDQLSDMPVVGGLFPSGGLTGNRPKPIEKLYEMGKLAERRAASKENPETDAEREKRLVINAATEVVGALMKERAKAQKPEDREAIMVRASHIAEQAATADPKDHPKFLGIAAGIKYRLEENQDKKDRLLYSRLDDLTDSPPRIGRRDVTRQNIASKMQKFNDKQESAREFLKESGVSDDDARALFVRAVTRGIANESGDGTIGKITSPDARSLRVRLLRQALAR